MTVTVCDTGRLVRPSVLPTAPAAIVLVKISLTPAAPKVAVNGIVMVQLPSAAMVPPVRVIPVLPPVAATPPPEHVVEGAAVTSNDSPPPVAPIGSSVNVVIVRGLVGLSLKMVIVNVDCWPARNRLMANSFVNLSGELIVRLALALAAGVSARVFTISAASKVLVTKLLPLAPEFVPITRTESVHTPDIPIAPPLKVTVVSPGDGINVPLLAPVPVQLTVAVGALATSTPAGRLSVTVVSGIFALLLGFVTVIVRVEV